ncbi:amidohydrolase family protein [Croceiramulus getboli]|nr:amidohydrolase family protein [Flavobacteriaceae bacterium YJPT1-3]
MKTFQQIGIGLLCLLVAITTWAQQTPAPEQQQTITITGATAHLGDGQMIKNSTIVFENGKIKAIGDAINSKIAPEGKKIDATGKHVYPGFIAPNTTLGLIEVAAVRASNDDDEIGDLNPHIRSIIAYNAESKVVESMRPNGVLMAQTTPQGGTISGTSSIVQLDAWNWEDAAIRTDDGVHLNWPRSFRRGRWWLGEDPGYSPNKDYQEEVTDLTLFMKNAKAYSEDTQEKNLPFEASKGLFDGSKTLYVHTDGEKEMLDAIAFKNEVGVTKMVFVGAYQGDAIADQLASNNIPVILDRTQNLPSGDDDDYDKPYKLAKLLTDAGVLVALGHEGEYWQARNTPFYAGQVIGQGMDTEEALKLITSNAAKILGIDDMAGTLEVGKDATLFISEGNALDMRGNRLTHAFIQGREISLETHQTELWKRYMEKYSRK